MDKPMLVTAALAAVLLSAVQAKAQQQPQERVLENIYASGGDGTSGTIFVNVADLFTQMTTFTIDRYDADFNLLYGGLGQIFPVADALQDLG